MHNSIAARLFPAAIGSGTSFEEPELPTNVIPALDSRAYEMVSPLDKNGGSIQGVAPSFGGGVFQAAPGGGARTYSSAASFGPSPALTSGATEVPALGGCDPDFLGVRLKPRLKVHCPKRRRRANKGVGR